MTTSAGGAGRTKRRSASGQAAARMRSEVPAKTSTTPRPSVYVEDGPRPGPIDDRGDGALAPLVEHRVWITVTGIGMADAVTAVMTGEAANAGEADHAARSRVPTPDVHGHVADVDQQIALDRVTIHLDHVPELRGPEVHEVVHVLAVVIPDATAESLEHVRAEIGGEGLATELGVHAVRADERDVLVTDSGGLQAPQDRGQHGADRGERAVGVVERDDDAPTAARERGRELSKRRQAEWSVERTIHQRARLARGRLLHILEHGGAIRQRERLPASTGVEFHRRHLAQSLLDEPHRPHGRARRQLLHERD